AADLQNETRWADARLAVERARARQETGDPEDLGSRLEQVRADLELVTRLETVRIESTAVREGHFDWALANKLYAVAFRDSSLDVDTLETREAVERIRARPIRAELTTALDEWAYQ